jgi:hypothetical protein
MSNNYQPKGVTTGGVINYGTLNGVPLPNSPDAALLNQQVAYAAMCVNFVATVRAFENGQDITNLAQAFYLEMMSNFPMTASQANAYFPGTTAIFWSANVFDYRAAFNSMTSTPFPS